MEKDSENIFGKLKDDLTAYVKLKLELLKLNTYERIGELTATLSYGLVLLFLAFFSVLFIFISLGFLLGEALDSAAAGFGIVAGIYLVCLGVILLVRNKLREKILNVVIAALVAHDEKKDESDNGQQNTDTTGETDF